MMYNFVSQPKPVTVITPTIGSNKLRDAVDSVKRQTYKNIEHLVVVDGPEYYDRTFSMKLDVKLSCTPQNTGKVGNDSFYGHRIYASYPHLVNSDYILFLDEDNWFNPDHVKSLVETIESGEYHFAYSMRKVFDVDKNYLCEDHCESLGLWPIYFTHHNPQYLVDTSSYIFKRSFLINTCQIWNWGWGGDRRFFQTVRHQFKHTSSRKHTMCYRLDGNPGSVNAGFFIEGNRQQLEHYKGRYPWT